MAFAMIAVETAFQQIVLEQALSYAQEMEKMPPAWRKVIRAAAPILRDMRS